MKSGTAPPSFWAVNSLRLVQVGLGPHGRNWARQVIPNIKEVDVVAYVDTDPYALDALREDAGMPADRCFESLKEAIAATEPEAMLNTTALPGHEPEGVYCEAWNPDWTAFTGPSVAVATLVFHGVVVSYRASWVSAGPITPWAGEWSMEFEHGEVVWTSAADSDVKLDKVVVRPRDGKPRTLTLPPVPRTGTWAT